ncbi:MAG: hypothetical protein CVU97_01045 [Firmicutes bacterium HGW-Firmicutes-21]|nr:MAG: hypothetical protein CVU97_01045 [Firmicutes bacterium HGW-Firmicutes-21]
MPEDSLFEQNPSWAGFDMLQAFINACHARDMELHIWMPIYYVGHGNSSNYSKSVGAKKPEWLSLTNTGSYYEANDTDKFMFLSPANPEVKEFLLNTYEYILTNYDIDGFQLDYIRYAARGTTDFGYDSTTVNAFKAKYGITPEFNTKASYWSNWVAFRASYVTDMVKSARELINRVSPQVVLSADVSPDFSHAYNYIYQDSAKWLEEGYLDMIHPMAYGEGYVDLMKQYISLAGDCYVGVGLGVFMSEFQAEDMLRQATEVSSIKAAGSVFFEASTYLNKGCGSLLTSTLYRNRALSPTYDERRSVLLLTEQAVTRIEEVILPKGAITSAKAAEVKSKLNVIKTSADAGLTEQVILNINSAITTVNTITNNAVKQALLDDLNYSKTIAVKALEVYNNVNNFFRTESINGNSVIIGFDGGTVDSMRVSDAKLLLGGIVTVTDKNGSSLSDNARLGTGQVLSNGKYKYTIVIMGDVNGDGAIGSVDYLLTKRIFLGTYTPDDYQIRAAAITDGVAPRASDYLKIKRHFLGSYNLFS